MGDSKRYWMWSGAALALILALVSGWVWGRPAYRKLKEGRLLAAAQGYYEKKDFRNATLSARQVLSLNPTNVAAFRLVAEMAEQFQSPQSVDLWRRVAALDPSLDHQLAVVRNALRVRLPALAAQVLEDVAPRAESSTSFHWLATQAALQSGSNEVARLHLTRLTELEPTNPLHRLNLAVVQLGSTNADTAAQARVFLEGIRGDTNFAPAAIRSLITDRLTRKDYADAKRLSLELRDGAGWAPSDRIQHLSILDAAGDASLNQALAAAQSDAGTNAFMINQVSTWMISRGMTNEAFAWLTNQPPAVRTNQPVPFALVDAYVARKDWPGLQEYLEDRKWEEEFDHVRLAYLSRAASERNQTMEATAHWRSAVRLAANRLSALTGLLAMANSLGRETEKEELLWEIVQRFPSERWALRELDRQYQRTRNTRGLNKLYATLARNDPANVLFQNNLAATSMLLKMNLTEAHRLAREAYQQHPDYPMVVSTYAYSLHLQDRTREGLELMAKLKPEQLESPSIALYYGLLLSGHGDAADAKRYLALAEKSPMFPEEQELVSAAKARL